MSISSIHAELLAIVDEFASLSEVAKGSASPGVVQAPSPVATQISSTNEERPTTAPKDRLRRDDDSGPATTPGIARAAPPATRASPTNGGGKSFGGDKVIPVAIIISITLILTAGIVTFRSLTLSPVVPQPVPAAVMPPVPPAGGSNTPPKRLPVKRPGRTEVLRPPPASNPVSKAIVPTSVPPAPETIIEQMLDRIATYMGQNSPGRAYQVAQTALDSIRVLQRSGVTNGALEELRAKAERLANVSLRQCDNKTDPNVVRTGCPP